MKEKHLTKLGFTRVDVSKKQAGGEAPFYYYEWEPYPDSGISLLSCSDDEAQRDGYWSVELYDDLKIKFVRKKHLKMFMKAITAGAHYKQLEISINELNS